MPPHNRSDPPGSPQRVGFRQGTPEPTDLTTPYKENKTRSFDPSLAQRSTGSSTNGGAAPSSVYLASHSLTRELSDLSGSCAHGSGNTPGSRSSVPGHICDQGPGKASWGQAYTLSDLPPQLSADKVSGAGTCRDATIIVSRDDVVEIVDGVAGNLNLDMLESTLNLELLQTQEHSRIPITILLMDGAKHSYELMQIWVDKSTDSVRDIVQILQKSVPDKWKQDYDGLFQVRGNRFTQLIHILRLSKYDIQPSEILIAKPWSMTAKVSMSYATSAIRHLTFIGVIHSDEAKTKGRRLFRPKSEDTPLIMSKEAQDRVYAPEGVFNHLHAVQFITFSPPFDPNRTIIESNNDRDDANSSLGSHCSGLGTDSIVPRGATPLPKSRKKPARKGGQISPLEDFSNQDSKLENQRRTRRSVLEMVSKLNCCKNKQATDIGDTTLTEEQEHQLKSFDVRPITEDHSEARHSNVSMSAPLLPAHYRI